MKTHNELPSCTEQSTEQSHEDKYLDQLFLNSCIEAHQKQIQEHQKEIEELQEMIRFLSHYTAL